MSDILLRSDLTPAEIDKLIELARQRPGPVYLEIGVWSGGTFATMVRQSIFKSCIGVDLFEDFVPSGDNTHISGTFNMTDVLAAVASSCPDTTSFYNLIKMDSARTAERVAKFTGMVFIDGNHTYKATKRDLKTAKELLISGYICIHNASMHLSPDDYYVARDGGPFTVVEEERKYGAMEYIGTFDRLAVFKK